MKNDIAHQYTKLDADHIDLRSLFQSLIEKKWFILTVSLTTCILAMIYALFKPTHYEASILFKIQHKQHNILGSITNPNQQLGIANTSEEPLSVQIALIKSEFVLRPVIKSLSLDISITPKYSIFDNLFSKKLNSIHISELQIPQNYFKKSLNLVVDNHHHYRLYNQQGDLLIQGNEGQRVISNDSVSIKVDKINSPINGQFTLVKHPESDVINKIHANLHITDLSGSLDNGSNKVAILRVSLKGQDPIQITRVLNEIALITQKQNKNLKSVEAEKTLEFLYQQLPIIRESLKEAEEKLNHYRSTSGRIDIKLQTQYLLTHLSDVNKQLEKIRLLKINMLQQYTVQHPTIISLNQELSELEKKRYELMDQLKKLPASDQEAVNLTREVNVKNNLYMILLNQIHQLEVIKTGIISDVQILSQASTPHVLQPIKLSVIGFVSLFAGLLLGSMGVLGWRIFIQRIDDPHWTEHSWNIKNLAIIPYSTEQALNSLALKLRQNTLPLLAYKSPNDIAIESLCNLRTFLQLNSQASQNNIIAIMGISKGIGKTFITVNLASLLARIGNKVLLIDGDIRDSHMNHYFSTLTIPGLTDVLNGHITIKEALIQSKDFDNLTFLSSGTPSERPADLLIHDSFKSLLLSIAKEYQYVLINTSSNIYNADNALIASLAGVNLLVIASHKHEASELNAVINNFRHVGIQLNGCIFNNLRPRKNKYNQGQPRLVSITASMST